ncbi:MAG: hydroxyacylglutathione hydrolase [Rivularia sp. (in: cyanobacteria)]
MQVFRIKALSDNYIFLLHDTQQNIAAVVDPAQAQPVLTKLDKLKAKLVAIFNTHHHYDHIGGNQELIEKFPQLTVHAGISDKGRIPGQKVFLEDGSRVNFAHRTAEVLFVPGHTRAHIAYYFPPENSGDMGELFCGDTLFAGGCGRLFEGTPKEMVNSLSKIRALPNNTRVWCAHEYTLNNLHFALSVDSENPELLQRYEQVKACRSRQEATVPSLLGVEKHTNPFLRWEKPALQLAANSKDSVETFAQLRGMKDRF